MTGSIAWADERTEEAAIKDLFGSFSKSWNQPGMPGFEDLFAEDADFVVITGTWLKGRSEIASYHRELLKGRYKGSHSSMDSVEVRFVNPRLAIAHVASRGDYTQDGTQLTRTGLATATLAKTDGKWLIAAFHNTLTSEPGAVLGVPTWTQPMGETDRELIRIQNEWAAARVKPDIAYLERLYAKEFRVQPMDGSVASREDDIAMFKEGRIKPDFIRDEDMKVSVYGEAAVVTGIENVGGTYRAGPLKGQFAELSLRFTNVFVHRDGRWQLVLSQSTLIPSSRPQ